MTLLVEVSPRDVAWDVHKRESAIVAEFYRDSLFPKYFAAMSRCSTVVNFYRDWDDDEVPYKLYSSNFCRLRSCPTCQWRRSLAWQSKMFHAIPLVESALADYHYRWLFLTLTVRNPQVSQLREVINSMQRSFRRLSRNSRWPAIGWIKSLEVTLGAERTAHPHFHCLLLVPPSYFEDGYLEHEEWIAVWKQSLQADYDPSIYISAIDEEKSGISKVGEVLKYTVKPSDLIADREWLLEYTAQIHGLRLIEIGGLFRDNPDFTQIEDEQADLIGKKRSNVDADDRAFFRWNSSRGIYELQN